MLVKMGIGFCGRIHMIVVAVAGITPRIIHNIVVVDIGRYGG
jgi:hypothetical protein